MILTTLLYHCKNVFVLINIQMIGKKFNKISIPEKKDLYSHVNMDDIIDANYAHAKRV